MSKYKKYIKSSDIFDRRITEYVENKSKLDKILKSKDRSRFSKDEEKFVTKLRQDKKRLLDTVIFPSMANLVAFFKYMAENPKVRDVFEEDLKELLGFIGKNTKYEDNIITKLLQSILKWDINREPNNFRLELISSIQNVLRDKILYLTLMDENLGDSVTNTIVNPDVGRALIWCRMFSARYRNSEKKREDQAREPNRPMNF
jgi:hypothetical protein